MTVSVADEEEVLVHGLQPATTETLGHDNRTGSLLLEGRPTRLSGSTTGNHSRHVHTGLGIEFRAYPSAVRTAAKVRNVPNSRQQIAKAPGQASI